jgi:autotransporter-associated beta strand protein
VFVPIVIDADHLVTKSALRERNRAQRRCFMRVGSWMLSIFFAILCQTAAQAQQNLLPNAIQPGSVRIGLQSIESGLTSPVYATFAPGDPNDLFVVDQTGKINVIHNGVVQPTPLLDIRSIENALPLQSGYDERGLLGLAFSPGFNDPASSGFHTLYTYQSEAAGTATADFGPAAGTLTGGIDHQNVLVQWKVSASNPLVVDTSTRRDLLREDHPESNHNGGTIAFGPDGDLYLAIGDGGAANDIGSGHIASTGNAQSLSVIMGKMLRLDPNGNNSANGKYGIPASNPFVNTASAAKEIYAYGLRNPYRFSFDSATGHLIEGDVGQNEVEEVNQINSGGNYGWAVKEGTFLFNRTGPNAGTDNPVNSPGSPAGLIDPILEYDHNAGSAVIGGFVYHGSLLPQLEGDYIFGDLSQGSANGRLFYSNLGTGQINEFKMSAPLGRWLKGFGEDANGEVYVLAGSNEGPSGTTGVVLEITPSSIWTGAVSTSWNASGNWTGVVPGATAGTTNLDTASFVQSAVRSPLAIDAGRNVQNIAFTTANVNSMTIGTVAGPALLLTTGGTIQTTSTVVNQQTINAPLVLEGPYSFISGAASSLATLNFGGGIAPGPTSGVTTLTLGGSNTGANAISGALADNGAGKLAVTKSGGGVWILSGANTNSGDIAVSSGRLVFNINSGSPTIAAGVTATVASGATLELAGSVSALGAAGGNRVHVVNNSTASGLVVSGVNQIVGAIDGSGATRVNAGSDLTANHIIQSALVIGGSGGNPGRVTINASDASGNPLIDTSESMVGEPSPAGLILANSLTTGSPFGAGGVGTPELSSTAGAADLTALSLGNLPPNGNVSPAPEPSTFALLGIGAMLCGRAVARSVWSACRRHSSRSI